MIKINLFYILIILFQINVYSSFGINDTLPDVNHIELDPKTNFYFISKIKIEGNKKTKKNIIIRELSINEGDKLNKSKILEIIEEEKRKLINTDLFNEVDLKIKIIDNNEIEIHIILIESLYVLPSIIFELSDRNFNDWWENFNHDLSRINYGAGLLHYNLSGRADEFEFSFRGGFIREVYSSYYIPYISKKQKGGLELSFNLIDYDHLNYGINNHVPTFYKSKNSLKKEITTSIEYSHRESFYNYHYFIIEHNNFKINDTLKTLNDRYYLDKNMINSINVGYEFDRDFRDIKNYPLNGFRLNIQIKKNGLGIFDDINKWKAKIYYSKYQSLKNKTYFSFNISSLYSSENQPFLLYESLDKIRGFEKYLINGYSYLTYRNTLKRNIFSKIYSRDNEKFVKRIKNIPLSLYFKIFYDSGYVWEYKNQNNNNFLNNKYIYSYGIGLDLVTIKNISFSSELSRNSLNEFNLSFNLGADF
jgi:outer membrane protein assembly factor BamA